MKIHILSDVHNEFTRMTPPKTDAGVVVLAGDIDIGIAGIAWAKNTFEMHVIYVAGNHEFYGGDLATDIPAMRKCAAGTSLHFLECNTIVIDDVRFVGATLWTSFGLGAKSSRDVENAMRAAESVVNDFRVIHKDGNPFTPEELSKISCASVHFLATALAEPFDGKTVVVTHHAPSPQSVHHKYAGNPLNGAVASDLEYLMRGPTAPALWIHGHAHDSFDNIVNGKTRVVANPRGYTSRLRGEDQENSEFNPALVVEI